MPPSGSTLIFTWSSNRSSPGAPAVNGPEIRSTPVLPVAASRSANTVEYACPVPATAWAVTLLCSKPVSASSFVGSPPTIVAAIAFVIGVMLIVCVPAVALSAISVACESATLPYADNAKGAVKPVTAQ